VLDNVNPMRQGDLEMSKSANGEYRRTVVAGGYMLVVPFVVGEWLANPRLPARMITADAYLAAIGPGLWALPWVNERDTYREEQATFGIDDAALPEVFAWVDKKRNLGEWSWPRIFTALEPAREFLDRFHPSGAPTIVGLGLPIEFVDEVLEEHPDVTGVGVDGYVEMLRRRQPLAAGGLEMGYEILGEEPGGDFDSWHVNGLEPLVHRDLGIVVNEYGLIDNLDTARRAAEYIGRPDVPAEPVSWRPWLLVCYGRSPAAGAG
jgi:hypothetical protein